MRILVDLKPALDGYAGIPQETRLLFSIFKKMGTSFDVDGLLQHGSGYLQAWNQQQISQLPLQEKVFRDSKTVASFCRNAAKTIIPGLPKGIQRSLLAQQLRWQAFRGKSIELGLFETKLFNDFIWRHLFSKTLPVEDKQTMTSARYRIISPSRKMFHQVGMKKFAPYFKPNYLHLDTEDYDYLMVQTPFPAKVSPKTRLIVRYHDAIPVMMPHTIGDTSFHQSSHFHALKQNVENGARFACISQATRIDLLSMFPELETKSSVIPNIVSSAYYVGDEPKSHVQSIVEARENLEDCNRQMLEPPMVGEYLLMVSTLEPRKNHMLLLDAWERLQHGKGHALQLIVVGNKGWQYEPIIKRMKPWIERGALHFLNNVPSNELRQLYRHARATICPSFAEGFDYSGVEAMRSGGVVVASDIPVHREVFEDASAYFDPYCVDSAVASIESVLTSADSMNQLKMRGLTVSARYSADAVLPKWLAFFEENSRS